eukprot:TRINITY_DN724_c0_g1_i3.p1 TRINITY_DN724_c0_g1~~TRINITY_DN724_c0_g1_i3.p1  ORF type:complete len:110 (-),score=22.41 TRINITY_DN724_c0_g1_i3:68-397(-)
MSNEEVEKELLSFDGVGPKTAACVMLFSLGRNNFPVDTHIHRIVRRLGIVPKEMDRIKTQEMMNKIVPEKWIYPGHLLIIKHGRTTCKAINPDCSNCCLTKICPKILVK